MFTHIPAILAPFQLYEVLDGYSEEVEKGFRSLEEKHSQIDK
jgi:hypothetical protein